MAGQRREATCGRMYHGAQFDACGLPRGHEGDHEGIHTKVRYRTISKTESERTGLGGVDTSDPGYGSQPALFGPAA